ncbi:MAG: IS200/IS605 family transposase [Flavobacteriales bacterium]
MARSYTQLYVHAVYSVKHRERMLDKSWRDEVFKYSCKVISLLKCKPIAVNGVADHVHILVGLHPTVSVSELVSKVKSNSSRFINEKFILSHYFEWQEGYSAFSNSQSQISRIATYIDNQERHHSKKTFREEYFEFLQKYNVIYDSNYLFEFFD